MVDTVHPVAQAFPRDTDGTATWDGVQQNLARAFPLTVPAADDVAGMDFSAVNATVQPEMIFCRDYPGIPFVYNPLSSADHNPPVSLKSLDDKRFIAAFVPEIFVNVIDHTLDTPPGSPANGDRYAIPAAPAGAWADHPNELTVYADGAWYFVPVDEGFRTYSRAVARDIQLAASGTWEIAEFEAGSVGPNELTKPWGQTVVEETATPPAGVIAEGALYIVGVNATGPWDDHDTDIAESQGEDPQNPGETLWAFYPPYEGASVYDLDLQIKRIFREGVWDSESSGYAEVLENFAESSAALSLASSGSGYTFNPTSPPQQTSNGRYTETIELPVQADFAGQVFDIHYDASVTGISLNGTGAFASVIMTAAVFIDSVAAAQDWCQILRGSQDNTNSLQSNLADRLDSINASFKITLGDTNPHSVKIIFFIQPGSGNPSSGTLTVARRRLKALKRS